MNTSNNNLLQFIKDRLKQIRKFIRKYFRIVLPVCIGIVVVIALVIGISAHNTTNNADESATDTDDPVVAEIPAGLSSDLTAVAVPEVALEEDAYPEVNDLMKKYYDALASGDIDTIRSINNNIDDTEALRLQETAKYVDHYGNLKVYTKLGPVQGTYLAFVYSEMSFFDYDADIPGLEAFYICTDENGQLYVNDGEESESVINYIRETSLQDDVVDLNNEVAVAYNNMLTEDENLSVFLVDLTDSIDTAVGEALAQAEGGTDAAPAEAENGEAEENSQASSEITKEVVTTVKATTTVNIRSSDSETADKLGKASEGQEFKLIEKKGNGWSEIEYNGSSAYIKSEYLEDANTETVITVADNTKTDDNNADNTTANANSDTGAASATTTQNTNATTTASTDSGKTKGTVMVVDNVRIRKEASTESDKIATAYMGEKLELIEKMSNGWSKVKYKGQVGYVKSEFVE